MKGYAMLKIGESGWIEKERPKCGPMDAICRPLAVAICTSDVHTLWEGISRRTVDHLHATYGNRLVYNNIIISKLISFRI